MPTCENSQCFFLNKINLVLKMPAWGWKIIDILLIHLFWNVKQIYFTGALINNIKELILPL